jgi:transcriptional regulator with XRE-family HTH domain
MASNNRFLTPEEVLDIYQRCKSGEKQGNIAREYVVSQATVSGIKRGYYWNDVTGEPRRRKLSPNQQRNLAIYQAYWEDKLSVKEIAARFGVSKSAVYDIRNGTTAPHVTGHPIRRAA